MFEEEKALGQGEDKPQRSVDNEENAEAVPHVGLQELQ